MLSAHKVHSSKVNQCTSIQRQCGHKRPRQAAARASAVAAAVHPAFMLEGAFAQPALQGACPPLVPTVAVCQPAVAAFPAVLSATARTAEQVSSEVEQQLRSHPQALVQAVEPEMYASLRKLQSGVQYHARAKMLLIKPKDTQGPPAPKTRRLPGMLCVVSGGPEDQAAADQVKLVAEHLGCFVTTKSQLSISNLQGIMDSLPALQAADAIVAIAGTDSNLPGAIAGLVDAPVIALPISQGKAGGLGELVVAVSSSSMGVSAVGIDQAAAAATMAARMLRVAAARVEKLTAASAAAAAATPAAVVNSSAVGAQAANNVVPTMLDSLSLTPALPTM